MVMNVGGSMIDLPLKDENGVIWNPDFGLDYEATYVENLMKIVSEELKDRDVPGSPFEISSDVEVYNGYYGIHIYGGLNGHGIWSNYFKALHEVFLRLEAIFEDVWMIRLQIDTADDVWDGEIGIQPYECQLKN